MAKKMQPGEGEASEGKEERTVLSNVQARQVAFRTASSSSTSSAGRRKRWKNCTSPT